MRVSMFSRSKRRACSCCKARKGRLSRQLSFEPLEDRHLLSVVGIDAEFCADQAVSGSQILFVDVDAHGSNDGLSWGDAYNHLQDALAAALSGDEIRVAQGTYAPDQGTGQTPGDRQATFRLLSGVVVAGGFAGYGATDPDLRDTHGYETILSGDLAGNDVVIMDPFDLWQEPSRNENSLHVVTGSGADATALLDGFTITGGKADEFHNGGGAVNFDGSPTYRNCVFVHNWAHQGGGMYNAQDEDQDADPTLINCTFLGNWGNDCGGGMYNSGSSPTLVDCVFSGNLAEDWGGGGMFNSGSSPTLLSCTLTGNWASDGGSGIYNSSSSPILTNCILWGNLGDQITTYNQSYPVITYSDIQGGWEDDGNIDADPLFVDADGPDDVFGTRDDDLRLSFGSSCIDAGDNTTVPSSVVTDLDGNPRFVDDPHSPDTGNGTPPIVDMGAYEFQGPLTLYVDDDAPGDPGPGDPEVSDPLENGTEAHPFDAIQEAIDAALDGETVVALDGTYAGTGNCNIDFGGKAITVRSENGPENCVIEYWSEGDDEDSRRGFHFHSGEGPESTLDGLTISWGGSTDSDGGVGVLCVESSPTIDRCTFISDADYPVMGMRNVAESRPMLTNCEFFGFGWAAMENYGSDPTLINCVFSDNEVAIFSDYSFPTLVNCTIVGHDMAIPTDGGATVTATNCIFWDNQDMGWEEAGFVIRYSCVQGGWEGEGNIDADPAFVDPAGGDYRLLPGSPCIDTGDNAAVPPTVVTDLDGNPRIEGAAVDMGAYESPATNVLYVDADAAGDNDGSSWAGAFADLQDALMAAASAPEIEEIRVADGVYTPAGPGGDRNMTFQLQDGLTIKGGYAGVGQPDPNARNIAEFATVLSGDLNGNDGPNFAGNAENSYHVVTGSGCDQTAVLDGFTITDGNASGGSWPLGDGGGMYTYAGSPTVTNCVFTGNYAGLGGAGMYNREQSHPNVINCLFTGNFTDGFGGGGMSNTDWSCPTMVNCTFAGNSAGNAGPAMYNWNHSIPVITNSVLWGNVDRAGIILDSPIGGWTPQVSYSLVQDDDPNDGTVFPGAGNIDDDPLFVDLYGADNQIGTQDENLRLLPGSPCLDAGDNGAVPPSLATDLDAQPRIADGTVDMGSYEGPDQGFLLSARSLVVDEGGTGTFTVALAIDPLGTVEVQVARHSGDPDVVVAAGAALTFDSSDYSTPKTVTIAPAEDDDWLNGSALIWVSSPGFTTAGITVTEWDNDVPPILYVDQTASGLGDGSSWANAHTDLQDAMQLAGVQPQVEEIRVAEGIYRPAGPGGDRAATFRLLSEVPVYGGFPSGGGAWAQRDPDAHVTILSGDLDADDAEVTGPEDLLGEPTREDNVYHVVTATDCDETGLLDGFTVTGGNANGDGSDDKYGGGIYVSSGHPTLSHCAIVGNTATYSGGGISGNATLSHCTFSGNAAESSFGGMACSSSALSYCTFTGNWAGYNGGAMSVGSSTLDHCSFIGNSAQMDGGGIANDSGSATLSYCFFSGNSAGRRGGGMDNYEARPTLNYCTFVGNSAEVGGAISQHCSDSTLTACQFLGNSATTGGGMENNGYGCPTLTNCTFSGNSAEQLGGAIYNTTGGAPTLLNCTLSRNSAGDHGGGICISNNYDLSPTLTNCILWDNQDPSGTGESAQLYYEDGAPLVDYCTVEGWTGGLGGAGNTGSDPLLVDADGADNVVGTEDDNLRLLPGSPCIDAADNTAVPPGVVTDLDGNPRFVDDPNTPDAGHGTPPIVDMGAYEFQGAEVIYVDVDAAGDDGSSWADAYNDLQDALAVASEGVEIWVAEGVYTPAGPDGRRTATFQLVNGVVIKGGFAGAGELDPNARDVDVYQTILSGDLAGNDPPYASIDDPAYEDNAYQVVIGSNTDASAVLDGFTITAGHANGGWLGESGRYGDRGGGMYNDHGSPTVADCTFLRNSAYSWEGGIGGGMYNEDSSPTLVDCSFLFNRADTVIPDHGAGLGGGMAEFDSSPTLVNCTFAWNEALGNDGGGIYHCGGSLELVDCNFTGNLAEQSGGGLCNWFGSVDLTRCTFAQNRTDSGGGIYTAGTTTLTYCTFSQNSGHGAHGRGGAIFNAGGSSQLTNCSFLGGGAVLEGGGIYNAADSLTLSNCLFDATAAPSGAAIHNASAGELVLADCTLAGGWLGPAITCDSASGPSTVTIRNSVLWNEGDEIQNNDGSTITVTYSDVRGGWPGEGNIDADPLFVDLDGLDNVPGSEDDVLQFHPGSPCIDAGDNGAVLPDTADLDGDGDTQEPAPLDLGGRPRFVDDPYTVDTGSGTSPIVDMGAYEYDRGPAPPPRLFVDADAGGANTGMSWADAFTDLQAALDTAYWGGTVDEVWVAAGTYRPSMRTEPDYPRSATFRVLNGVGLFGGFAGGETSLAERDVAANETVLSGDLAADDVPGAGADHASRQDNAYHVVTGINTNQTAVLDGFTITAGNAGGGSGGGMYNDADSPTVSNCTFRGNSAAYGGAMVPGYATVTNCVFSGNSAVDEWGDGGAIFNLEYYPTFINCTFSGNSAPEHSGGYVPAGGIASQEGTTTVTNCILWGNTGVQVYGADVSYSCVEGGAEGPGNVAADPLLVDPDGPDDVVGTEDDNLRLLFGSPCIDAADNTAVPPGVVTDLDFNPRFFDDPNTADTGNGTPPIADMGAYEFPGPSIIYVDADAAGSNSGSSWADACDDLQDALAVALEGDEIRVAEGVYIPAGPGGDRQATFQLVVGVALKGGYAGYGAPDPNARDFQAYETILSGDLNGDDGPGLAGNEENCYKVVTGCDDPEATGLLEGFTITGGNANGPNPYYDRGGGLDNWWNNYLEVAHCTFVENYGVYGGAVSISGAPTLRHCTFAGNAAEYGGGLLGGWGRPTPGGPTLENCTFTDNFATYNGGGLDIGDNEPTLLDCTFTNNSAGEDGGGAYLSDCSGTVINCLFTGNQAGVNGGGIDIWYSDSTSVINSTFVGNHAHQHGGGVFIDSDAPSLTNCIIWGNTHSSGSVETAQVYVDSANPTITYNCIQDADPNDSIVYPGEGNIDDDPLFLDAASGNYRLTALSPVIDAGNNAAVPLEVLTDLDGNPRFVDDPNTADTGHGTPPIVDMGAYEYGASLLVDHFELSTIDSPQHAGTPFGVTVTARDALGRTMTDFGGTVGLSGWMETGPGSTIVISEVDAASPDMAEFTNVSGMDVDVSGWQVLIYDRNSGTSPQTALTIPADTICAAGGVFLVEQDGTAPGTYPHFYLGSGVSWRTDGSIGVLLLDGTGEVVDFMAAADLDPAQITNPVTIVPDYWQGDQVPVLPDYSVSYQRVGDVDNDNAGDWVLEPASLGSVNPGLTLPFAPEQSPVAITPTATGAFVGGVWTGQVTVLEVAVQMFLRADDYYGQVADSNRFDVELPPGEIRGSKWYDLDRDGEWDADEPGLSGWKIYVDLNDNGRWDEGEPYDRTDAAGDYAITGLSPGTYVVGEVARSGWEQTYPGGTVESGEWRVESGEWTELDCTMLSGAASEPLEMDTAWIDGAGPSALRNLDQQLLAAESALEETAFLETGVYNIYVEAGLLSAIDASLGVYVADLTREGYQVSVQEFSGTADGLRTELQSQWTTNALEGALLVGDLPYVIFTSEDNYNPTPVQVSYPHDLYFMDLDGSYVFNPGGLDEHVDGSGDVGPEIYISRITTGNLGGVTGLDEATLINRYFAKVHDYRTGRLTYENRGIVFADDDWDHWTASMMQDLYPEVLAITDPAETTKQSYLDTLQLNYESILEALHSSATSHSVRDGGSSQGISNREIFEANPRPAFYNMFNCSSAKFTTSGYLAGVYVYGGDYGLNSVGTTKVGSMLSVQDYYRPQGSGDSVGQAFLQWFDRHAAGTNSGPDSYVDWFYGMTMQGDPTLRPASMPGSYTDTHTVDVQSGQIAWKVDFGNYSADPATVADRHVFYNNSVFDGNQTAANVQDDNAIAGDKEALLPGDPTSVATFANYTSYGRGINGIMVDIAGWTDPEGLSADSLPNYFEFRVGNDEDFDNWEDAPPPVTVAVRETPDTENSYRVTLIWPDYAVHNQWLEVTVLGADFGLANDDVFYFGNALGESGNSTTEAIVDEDDVAAACNNPRNFFNPAQVTFPYDYNRDARVNAADMLIARSNQTTEANALKLIRLPALGGEAEGEEPLVPAPLAENLLLSAGKPEGGNQAADVEKTSTHDAVFDGHLEPESAGPTTLLGKWAWLDEFEQISTAKRSSKKDNPVEKATDRLLATYWL